LKPSGEQSGSLFAPVEKELVDHILVVGPFDAGKRLDVFLPGKINTLSRARIQAMIRSGHILLNGISCRAKQTIRTGDRIDVSEPEPERTVLEPENLSLLIVYEDEHLVVVNKPAGMTVHPGAGIQTGTLVNALLYHVSNLSGVGGELRPGVVHRLDKETSGCLVVAKNDVAHTRLSAQFAGRKVQKFYLALCAPGFAKSAGEILKPIGRHPVHRQKMAVVDRGRPARTRYEVVCESDRLALIVCQIFTGRTHQIRVHLQSIGHPLLGDKLYGTKPNEYGRQMLHAWQLGFFHPVTENWLEFEAGLPDDFVQSGVEESWIVQARSVLGRRNVARPETSD
jgi:23S rRNA pseudouridine1911/1915/1917 synthase